MAKRAAPSTAPVQSIGLTYGFAAHQCDTSKAALQLCVVRCLSAAQLALAAWPLLCCVLKTRAQASPGRQCMRSRRQSAAQPGGSALAKQCAPNALPCWQNPPAQLESHQGCQPPQAVLFLLQQHPMAKPDVLLEGFTACGVPWCRNPAVVRHEGLRGSIALHLTLPQQLFSSSTLHVLCYSTLRSGCCCLGP